MRIFNICSEYYFCYIICACMYAEIMWDCSYTCMCVRCVYIRTNANLVSVRTRLTVVSLSEPHTSDTTDVWLYVSIYVSMHMSLPPRAPMHAHMNLTPILAHFSLYSTNVFAVVVKDSSYKLTAFPHF